MSQKNALAVDDETAFGTYSKSVPPGIGLQTIELHGVTPRVILLAEDDVGVRFLIWKLLKAQGFTVLIAGDGKAALESSRDYAGTIDLLVSDVSMPRMGGLELRKNIAIERPGIKVLLISGDNLGREQVALSGLPFLQKPFTQTALRDSIETLLGAIVTMT
jgi:DNA-binding NtrC family response regulator